MENLFSKISNPDLRDKLSKDALPILHQGGLLFASHHCLVTFPQVEVKRIKLSGEKIIVNLIPEQDGLLIKEENTYPELLIDNNQYFTDSYYGKTESEVLFSAEGIQVKKLTIDCPNRYAARILDQRSFTELLNHMIKKLLHLIDFTCVFQPTNTHQ